ncbi:MAG TPA: preprotein translocase subunit SecE [Anaerolineales bacterium]|nr:preprotein translocase subunit SecE [Anaerolineales bacterium]
MAKAQTARRQNLITRISRETVGELRKVNWPSREEATQLTIIVLVVLAASSMFLGALDYLFTSLFRLLVGA